MTKADKPNRCPAEGCDNGSTTRHALNIHTRKYHGASVVELEERAAHRADTAGPPKEIACPAPGCTVTRRNRKLLGNHTRKDHGASLTKLENKAAQTVAGADGHLTLGDFSSGEIVTIIGRGWKVLGPSAAFPGKVKVVALQDSALNWFDAETPV